MEMLGAAHLTDLTSAGASQNEQMVNVPSRRKARRRSHAPGKFSTPGHSVSCRRWPARCYARGSVRQQESGQHHSSSGGVQRLIVALVQHAALESSPRVQNVGLDLVGERLPLLA